MSEEHEDQQSKPYEWAAHKAANDINRLTSRKDCLMCGSDDWLVLPISEHQGTAVPFVRQLPAPFAGYGADWRWWHDSTLVGAIPTATFICRHCGFVRQHVLGPKTLTIGADDDEVLVAKKVLDAHDFEELQKPIAKGKDE